MLLWFVATSILAIGFVFRDPAFDHRLLVVGSVLPGVEVVVGGARALHSVTVSIALLAIVMIATRRGSARRRTLLGLPIGVFLHLVFDAAWNDTDTFWWPVTGWSFDDVGAPIVDRGVLSVVLEAVGVVVCAWLWRINHLGERENRRRFLADGRLVSVPPSGT
ncbi:metal-dependent hydrolase [Ilumatobacter sp.]|uniref:metal-dependent hydrolase n=1 Tax=Ilumatobacter sp. TaxID=1967498 RepID=UPI003B51B399